MVDLYSRRELERFMRLAIDQAKDASLRGELPIGAVLVIDGDVLSTGQPNQKSFRSHIAHAELQAIMHGGEQLYTAASRATLFCTMEPCPLCLAAAVTAQIPHIVFSLEDSFSPSAKMVETVSFFERRIQTYEGGLLRAETEQLVRRTAPQLLR